MNKLAEDYANNVAAIWMYDKSYNPLYTKAEIIKAFKSGYKYSK